MSRLSLLLRGSAAAKFPTPASIQESLLSPTASPLLRLSHTPSRIATPSICTNHIRTMAGTRSPNPNPPQPASSSSSGPSAASSSSSSSSAAASDPSQEQHGYIAPDGTQTVLSLPWHDSVTPSSADSPNVQVNGDSVRLDSLGPMVINADGTMSRISNWAEMSDMERATTMRLITKRNRERREALLRAEREKAAHENAPER